MKKYFNENGNRLIKNNEEVYILNYHNHYLQENGEFGELEYTWKIMSDNYTSINFENNLSYTFEYYTVDTNDYYNISDTSINLTFEIDNTELEFTGVSYNDTTLYSFSSKQFLYVDNETINVDNLNVLVSKDMDCSEEISILSHNSDNKLTSLKKYPIPYTNNLQLWLDVSNYNPDDSDNGTLWKDLSPYKNHASWNTTPDFNQQYKFFKQKIELYMAKNQMNIILQQIIL